MRAAVTKVREHSTPRQRSLMSERLAHTGSRAMQQLAAMSVAAAGADHVKNAQWGEVQLSAAQ